jgi:signal transduction histidine kinase
MPNTGPINILVVDDEKLVRQATCTILSSQGYACLQAESADQAWKLLQSAPVTLCLLDISMPETSGLEFLEKIRPDFPELPVIIQSSNNDLEMAGACLNLGVDDYLIKPVRSERLLISVQNVLEQTRWLTDKKFYHQELERKLVEQKQQILQAQALLLQQEKLAAIGQVAAGVGHEINNPIGYITSNLNALKKYFDRFAQMNTDLSDLQAALDTEKQAQLKDILHRAKFNLLRDDAPELIDDCLDGVNRLKKIAQGLKSFARTDTDEAVEINVQECLENAITMVWNELKHKAELVRDYGECPPITGYPQQLSQVFMNILVNAAHAIESRGVISVSISANDEAVRVSIHDNGCGIAPENLDKIFEPFFTTKPAGQGTGLGMSIVKDIVDKHAGTIRVESTLGSGTQVFMSFSARKG